MALSRKPQEIVEDSNNPLLAKHESWGRVPVGDIADILNGFAFKSSKFTNDKGIPLIRIRDVGKDSSETYYDGEYDETYLVNDGDLLVGMDGDFRASIWKGGKALLNQRVCKISLKTDEYDFKFLSYVLQPYLDAIHAETSAVTVKHLSSKSISEIPLPLPPKEQQKRIVAKIEELFSHIDAGIEALKKAKQLLKQYRQSVLKAAVTGELTKEWREARIKDDAQGSANVAGGRTPGATKLEPASQLLERILETRRQLWEEQQLEQFKAKGKMPKDDKWKKKYTLEEPNPHMVLNVPEEWAVSTLESITDPVRVICYGILMPKENVKDGVLYVKVKDIKGGKVLLEQLNRTAPKIAKKYERASLSEGDLLLTIRGTYGRTAIAPVELEGGNITQDTVRISAISPISNEYLKLYIDSNVVQHYFKVVARGVAVKGVNVQDVRNMDVSIPSREEQDEIIRLVDEKVTSISHLENELEVQLLKAEKNKQSILASAFIGNLHKESV